MKKIAILGGGASALMCACFASINNKVTIIEKNEKLGKKILVTGNGRCNLTNLNMGSFAYNQNIDVFLQRFSDGSTIEFFNKIGLAVYVDEQERVYPLSNSAVSVVDVLKNYLTKQKNVKFLTGKEFVGLQNINDKYKVVFGDNSALMYDKVVVALGNYADLSVFKKLGIKCKQFKPSLCALKAKIDKNLVGVRVSDVVLSCHTQNINFNEFGEALFRQDGLSGIVTFNLSAHLARKNIQNANIKIDFIPSLSTDKLKLKLYERKQNLSGYKASDFLTGFFHNSLNKVLLKNSQINPEINVEKISENQIDNLCKNIKEFNLEINGYLDNNQVCTGGILLKELTKNLESKTHKGLYFIGEMVDVDGVCGGYNLQWAWTSGKIVGENV